MYGNKLQNEQKHITIKAHLFKTTDLSIQRVTFFHIDYPFSVDR